MNSTSSDQDPAGRAAIIAETRRSAAFIAVGEDDVDHADVAICPRCFIGNPLGHDGCTTVCDCHGCRTAEDDAPRRITVAARQVGQWVSSVQLDYDGNGNLQQAHLYLRGKVQEAEGRAVFAALGIEYATCSAPYGSWPQMNLKGRLQIGPRLSVALSAVVRCPPPSLAQIDEAELVAELARRRGADQPAD